MKKSIYKKRLNNIRKEINNLKNTFSSKENTDKFCKLLDKENYYINKLSKTKKTLFD